MKLKITTKQYDMLLSIFSAKFPVVFDGRIAPIVNKILKKYEPL